MSHLSICFMDCAFLVSYLRSLCLILVTKIFSHFPRCRRLVVLVFTLRPMIHFEIILIYGMAYGPKLFKAWNVKGSSLQRAFDFVSTSLRSPETKAQASGSVAHPERGSGGALLLEVGLDTWGPSLWFLSLSRVLREGKLNMSELASDFRAKVFLCLLISGSWFHFNFVPYFLVVLSVSGCF